jgi:hypothetical protein
MAFRCSVWFPETARSKYPHFDYVINDHVSVKKTTVQTVIATVCMTKTTVYVLADRVNVIRGRGIGRFSRKSKYPHLDHVIKDHVSRVWTFYL